MSQQSRNVKKWELTMKKNNMFVSPVLVALVLFICISALFSIGCGVISVLGTPTNSEKTIDAEFDLAAEENGKIVVYVDQPAWINAPAGLRQIISDQINARLTGYAKIDAERIISYGKLSQFRSSRVTFDTLTAQEVGRGVGADVVIVVTLSGYTLEDMAGSDIYEGSLDGQVSLVKVEGDEQLWPEDIKGRVIKVGIDMESKGASAGVARMASAFGHCATRYLYSCPKNLFKIREDRSGSHWQEW